MKNNSKNISCSSILGLLSFFEVVLLCLFSILYCLFSEDQMLSASLIFFSALFCVFEIVISVIINPLGIVQPKVLVLFMYFLLYVVRPSIVLTTETRLPAFFTFVLLLGLVGFVFFNLGHLAFVNHKSKTVQYFAKYKWNSLRLLLITSILAIASIGSLIYFISEQGGLSSLYNALSSYRVLFEGKGYLYVSLGFLKIAAVLWLVKDLSEKKAIRKTTVILVVFALVFASFGGSRTNIIVFIVSLTVANTLIRKTKKNLYLLSALLIITFFIIQYRYIFRGQHDFDRQSLQEVAKQGFFEDRTFSDFFDVGNFGMTDYFSEIVVARNENKLPLQWGLTYLAILTQPIPRNLWPEKLPGAGEVGTKAINSRLWKQGSGYHFSIVGELYINWSIPGIILGMFFFGMLSKATLCWIENNQENVYVITVYSMSLLRFASLTKGESLVVVTSWLVEMIILIPTLKLVLKKEIDNYSFL